MRMHAMTRSRWRTKEKTCLNDIIAYLTEHEFNLIVEIGRQLRRPL